MGVETDGRCLECGAAFTIRDGGGFFFHLVRCEACGETKSIGFDELGPLHAAYVKGLRGPYSTVSMAQDRYIQEQVDIEPLSEEDYHRAVEIFAGECACGGKFSLTAPFRCPACRSTHVEPGETTMFYD
jgi:hypothetical protein